MMFMIIKKSKYNKLLAEKSNQSNRIKQLEDIICPCEQHEFIVAGIETTYPYLGGQSVEVLDKRKLICKKCKKIVYDYEGCGNFYKYEVVNND